MCNKALYINTNEEKHITVSVGEKVYVEENYKDGYITTRSTYTYEQFDSVIDDYLKQIGEDTVEELKDKILKLENQNEELKSKLQQYEEYKNNLMDKYYDCEGPF